MCVHVRVCRHTSEHIELREEPVVFLGRSSTSFREYLIGLVLPNDARLTSNLQGYSCLSPHPQHWDDKCTHTIVKICNVLTWGLNSGLYVYKTALY